MAWVRAVGRRLAAGLLLLVAGLLGVSTAGQAQTLTTFVSNTNETAAAGVSLFLAQSFFTASDIVLSEIEILMGEGAGDAVAKIRENNADDRPGDLVAELTSPTTVTANSLNSFTAPAGTTLDENTTYWITWGEGIQSFADIANFMTTNSDDETGETGWEIDDNYLWKSSDSATSWSTAGRSLMIAVKGTVVGTTLSTDATLSALTVNDGTSVTPSLTPPFVSGTYGYAADVGNAVTTATLTATPTHTGASVSAVTLGGTAIADTDFTDGITVPSLAEGDNEIVVTVTAEDGSTTETYMVTVTRAGTTTTVPGAPTSLTATANGSTQIDLSWTAPAENGGSPITGYKIEVSPNGTSSWTNRVANTGTTTTTYSHTGLSAGTTGHYRVSAINSVGTGAASRTANATTTTVPGYPTGLTATPSGTSTINLTWDAPSNDGGAAITGYRIEVSPNGTSSSWSDLVANTNSTSTGYSHTGLSAGTTRHYRVSAINSVGTGAASRTANATTTTVPGYPTGLSATADGTSTIDLDWTAPSDDGGASITGYRIEVSPNGTSSSWSDLVANTNSTSTSYSHTGLSAGTTRHYRVSAINSVGTGAASRTANATTDDAATTVPDAPTGLSATADGTSTIDLDWTAPSDDGGASITGYRIEVSPNGTSSSWSDLVANTNSTSTSYSHTGLSAGTTRHYRVSAINSVGTGAASRTANATTDDAATTVPDAPTGLTATADGTSTIDLDWTAPSDDGGASITGYRIEVSPNGTSSSWSDLVANTNSTSTSYSHTGLSAGTTRHYRVSAINSVGTGAASRTANATTDDAATTVPDAPTGLSATADGTSTIDLDWTAPTDNGGASITGYRIEVSSNGSSGWSNREANTNSTSTSYSHTGLSAGITRHYRVSAINSVGTGDASRTANATTDAAATTVPDAPTGLSATADGTSTIDLDWTAPTDNGGSDITGYRIEVSSNGSSGWSNREANTNSTSTTYAHTGLSAGTTRHYRVSAINSVGTGDASSTANATTDAAAPTVPGAPTGLSATADGTSTIDLDWTAPTDNGGADITGYRIEVSSNGSSGWSNREANTNSTSTTYAHTGLSAGDTRHYRVSAINSVGTGDASSTANATTDDAAQPGLAVVTVHALAPSVSVGGTARFELRRSGGDMGWLKVSYRHDESSDGNYVKSWGYFKPGVTRKGAAYDVGRSPGTVTARVTGPSNPLCTEDNDPSDSCTDNYMVGNPSSASMQVTASASSSAAAAAADDALEDALTLVDDLTPDVAAAVLLGEQTLGEAELAALDLLGNRNGRYDLGDLLSWIERCRRGEAHCGRTSTGSGPPSAAGLLAAAAAGRPWISRRTRRRGSGRPGRKPIRAARRRGRFAGYALATLLAVTMTLSCTEGSVGPAAYVPDPGFLTVEWTGPAAGRGIGVLLELEGPGIEAVRAPGFELYESRASGRHEIVVAGSLRAGPLVQFRVPDRGQLPLYRVRVLEVAGEDYELRDAGEYRAVITLH